MKQEIEGLFLSSIVYTDSSVIVQMYTLQQGRQSFIFKGVKKRNRPYIFQPFHFIDFLSVFNNEKNINVGTNPTLNCPFYQITNDIRKTSVALFITEVLSKFLKEGDYSEFLYPFLKQTIINFENNSFSSNFHLFFLIKLFPFLGIQPNNNFSSTNCYFSTPDGKFISSSNNLVYQQNISETLSLLLGTNIDNYHKINIDKLMRSQLLELLLNYFEIHLQINTQNITSHKVLKTIFT